jgi:hypothetical protein
VPENHNQIMRELVEATVVVTRRRFLLLTGAAASAALVAAGAHVARPYLSKRAHPQLDKTYPLGMLREDEMSTAIALGEVLVPAKFTPPADFFREYVNWVTQTQAGYLREYERAVRLLDTTAHSTAKASPFRDLTVPERNAVLQMLLWRYDIGDEVISRLEKFATSRDASALRQYVVTPMLEYYYRSPDGWAVVGYKHFPGVPAADPLAYTKPLEREKTAG